MSSQPLTTLTNAFPRLTMGSTGRDRTHRHTATYPRIAQNTQNKPDFPSRGFDTINTQDKVICDENMNYAKIQNKEEESENTQINNKKFKEKEPQTFNYIN